MRTHRRLQLRDPPRLVLRAAVPQDDDELVTGEARAQVVLAHGRLQHAADRAQRAIARLVTVGIVDLLQPIEIEDDHADAAVRPLRMRQSRLEPPIERSAIRQPGQRIRV
jgi:hypothetical protein